MLRIILVLFSLIKIFAYKNFTFYKELKKDQFGDGIPQRFHFSSDGNITFITLKENIKGITSNIYMIDYKDSPPVQIFDNIFTKNNIYSATDFYIDNEDNYYLLDQGQINKENIVTEGTSKIISISSNITDNNNAKIINFKSIDLKNSFLTDIVVEQSGEYAYIVDSGNNNPGIIVVNLINDQENAYKVLNNHEPFKPSKNKRRLTEGKRELYKFSNEEKRTYTIRLSCNDETLYFSSKTETKIYSVSTSEIKSAIKRYKNSKTQSDLDKITVYSANKGFNVHNFLISSSNNMFILNNNDAFVEVSFNIDKDLSNYKIVNTTKMYFSKDKKDKIYSIDAYNGNLYILDFAQNDIYHLDKAEIKNGESNSYSGCSVFIFKISGANIFIFVYFFLVLVLTIIIIIANSGNALEKSKIKKDEAKKANIEELNKNLNE